MNREERRRAEREARRAPADRNITHTAGRWQAPPGRVTSIRNVNPERQDAEVQDFTNGTIFAHGAAVLYPTGLRPGETLDDLPPPVFVVMLTPDASTYGPCPQLRTLFERLDRDGAAVVGQQLVAGSSWSVLARPDGHALVKLKLDFQTPIRASARILLLAENYAPLWQYIADGGIVGLTTPDRLERASHNAASMADGLEACVPIGIATSPGIHQLIRMFHWPADHLAR